MQQSAFIAVGAFSVCLGYKTTQESQLVDPWT